MLPAAVGKKLSNQDWVSESDSEGRIAKMKDGTPPLTYKPAHAVDLDTGAVVAAEESSSHSIDPANLGYHRGHNSRVCRRCPFVGPERWK